MDIAVLPSSPWQKADEDYALAESLERFRLLNWLACVLVPKGAFTATTHPARVEETRTVYLDQYSGKVLGDVGFAQYGPAAKAIEWGIAVHQGQEYGSVNRYVMLTGCIAIVLLAISAPVMWWKRRPKGSFGLPPAAGNRRAAVTVMAIMAIAGLVYPLAGLSMLAGLMFERLYDLAKRAFARRVRVLQ